MPSFDFLEKGREIVSASHFVYGFPGKMFHVSLYQLTKFHRQIAFTS